ncbi:MAG TPA: T9SS type A sorting domain-containing protein, partial [Flavilitoribacter sp.]|nr:T9SS type A sorting domain-containing protein [Flavilitoribacter sp.]
ASRAPGSTVSLKVGDEFDSVLAADINNSGTIPTLDAIQLRKLILNVTTSFANNTSWRFVDGSYLFPVPNNPWFETFPEIININDLSGQLFGQDFIGVKIGDLNGSVQANALDIEPRNLRGMFYFDVDEMHLKAGNEYRIAFTAADIAKVQGYQGTLKLDPAAIELKDLVGGVAKAENFGMRFAGEGMITFSWNRAPIASAEGPADVLFTLVVQAMADADLSDVLAISSRYTLAEAYDKSDELMDLGLRFNNGPATELPFELYQNKPNPFGDRTVIGFQLPEDSEVTITIHDVSGKAIRLIRDNYAKGYNQLTLTRRELNNATGVLYYTVTAGEHTATKKMVVMSR